MSTIPRPHPFRPFAAWVALGLGGLVLVAYVAIDLYSEYHAIEQREVARLIHQTALIEANITRRLRSTRDALDSIRADLPWMLAQTSDETLIYRRLKAMVAAMTGVRTLLVINAAGVAIASNRVELIGHNFIEGERFQAIRRGNQPEMLYLSPPFVTALGTYTVSAGLAVIDEQGRFDGCILAILDPEDIVDALRAFSYAPDLRAELLHGDGQLIFRPLGGQLTGDREAPTGEDHRLHQHLEQQKDLSVFTGDTRRRSPEPLMVLHTLALQTLPASNTEIIRLSRDKAMVLADWQKNLHSRLAFLGLIALISITSLLAYQRRQRAYTDLQQLREAERGRAEDALRQANLALEGKVAERTAQLAAANHAKSEFLAHMSHEIRTPLNVIIGQGELLREASHDTASRRRLTQLCENSSHLLAIINDVLDLSKIEAGQCEIEHIPFRPGDVVARVLRLFADRAIAKGLHLTADAPPDLLDQPVLGDPLRLAQILINLCGNAIKFTEHGQVCLGISQRNSPGADALLRFTVSDTGCGIDPASQARIFQPFFQATATRRHEGTGLGLSICHHLVARMGGHLELVSRPGSGSTFSFAIPLPETRRLPAGALPGAAPSGALRRGSRILLAEDHPQSQEILLEMLERLGCDVDIASNGREAVNNVRTRPYDLILMDVHMPVLDGLQATQEIRALPGQHDTPIIAITADVFTEERARCLAAGMNSHLGKPVTSASLAEVLQAWLPQPVAQPTGSPPPCHSPLSQALQALPELQIEPAWLESPEQAESYRQLLTQFIASQRPGVATLRQHLAAGEPEAASALAHDLKGIAGLLGAREIATEAGALESCLRQQAASTEVRQVEVVEASQAALTACERALQELDTALQGLPPR